ncbi:hypothetical protein [Nostoc sp. TCL26-01]|uniref:hypothetical protein n=1 Tax=Nostoc sp. TCL26-01 TaxID=2576904 RepID=UPI0015B7B3B1|nr:hypothetical protein [Nostoc sp. TCL26-01]QLE55848.1 hypothetical protein FD725_10130 [Nostoc sp. TCL26-01]
MDGQQSYHSHQIEITDLIPQLVENAVARRNQVFQENALSDLSEEEANNVAGGQIIVAGFKPIFPPIIVGLIAVDPTKLLA